MTNRLAFYLCNDLHCWRKNECGFQYFQKCMQPCNLHRKERRAFQYTKRKNACREWNILTESQNYLMCVMGLQSYDHKTDHAISIAGKWIFDSNFEYALPLTQHSLDMCCSSDSRSSTYVGVTRVCMLKPMLTNVK